jgi:DNA repair exonuclease SbcCD ATPase subunit
MAKFTDLDVAVQLEQLWQKIQAGITLSDRILAKGKVLDEEITQKQQEAIADLESRYQEILKVQSSLADVRQEFLELGELKQTIKSSIRDIDPVDNLSNFIADLSKITAEVTANRSQCDRLQAKLEELDNKLPSAIADNVLQEQTLLLNEAVTNFTRLEDRTLTTFNSQNIQIDNLVLRLENTLQTNRELNSELETKFQEIALAYRQIQNSLTQVNSELAIQGMKQVEQIHLQEQTAKKQLSEFSENLLQNLNTSSAKESLEAEIEQAKKAIAQLLFQRQEIQRELATSAEIVRQLTQAKVERESLSLERMTESEELRNKLKLIEQKYDRLHQSVWWLSIGISVVVGIAIAFGKFIFR